MREVPRPRVPNPAALEQIKKQPSAARKGDITPAATKAPQQKAPVLNCATNSSVNFAPSDIHGAVGPTNIITVTNADIGVYNKSNCSLVSKMALNTLFAAGAGEQYFDPQVLWDNTNGRFIVTAESCVGSCDTTGVHQNQGFAVSQDNTGTSWSVYKIQINNGSNVFCVPDAT